MQEKKILLCGKFLDKKYPILLKKAGFEIAGIINDDFLGITSARREYVSFDKLKNIPPILLNELDCEKFLNKLNHLRSIFSPRKIWILHPSFFAEYAQVKFRDRILVAGANRSGSTLLFNVLKRLMDFNVSNDSKDLTMFSELSKSHYDLLTTYLNNIFKNAGASYSSTGAVTFRYIDYVGAAEKVCFFLSPIRAQRYFFDKIHRTHTPINVDMINRAEELNYPIFVPIRNPLDIIVSNAFELEYVFYNMFPGEDLDLVESDFRENYGRAHFTNLDWFEGISAYVKKHMESYLTYKSKCTMVKYEDLMMDPVGKMKELSELLCVKPIPESTLKKTWETQLYCKPLATYKAHMFRPGIGKSKQYLCREHIDILKKFKFGALLKELGYDTSLESSQSINSLAYPDSERLKFVLQIRDKGFNVQLGTPLCYPGKIFVNKKTKIANQQLRFSSNSASFTDTFINLLKSDEFRTMISLLDFPK